MINAGGGWGTYLFSDPFSTIIDAVIRVLVHIRVCNQNVEFLEEVTPYVRPFRSYLSRHLVEVSRISPHAMDEHLSNRN